MNNKYIICNNNDTLKKEIIYALNNNKSNNVSEIAVINKDTASIIKELTGINVNNRKQLLYDNDIRHMINKHGSISKEKSRNQLPINIKDLLNIPNILENYDSIVLGSSNREGYTIRYIKKMESNITIIVEVVPKKSNLKIKTMWKSTLDDDK